MNTIKRFFPLYFGPPQAADINAVCLRHAQSELAQLLTDRDILSGQIAACEAIVARLQPCSAT